MMNDIIEKIRSYFSSLRLEEFISLIFIAITTSGALFVGLTDLLHDHPFPGTYSLKLLRLLFSTSVLFLFFRSISSEKENQFFIPLRDFSPFLFILVIYLNIHDTIVLLNPHDIHDSLVEYEQAIFGIQPSVWLEKFYQPWLTDWFALSYLNYYLITPILLILLYRKHQIAAFRIVMSTTMIAYFIGFLGYIFFPASSPYQIIQDRYSVDIWQDTSFVSTFVQFLVGLSPHRVRDAFPSMHNTITLLTMIMAWRYHRLFFWIQLPLALSLVFATVYLRYHYVVDIFAAIPVVMLAFYLTPRLQKQWQALNANPNLKYKLS